MFRIDYLVTYGDGDTEYVAVTARSINGGYAKALKIARLPLGSGVQRNIASIAFQQATR